MLALLVLICCVGYSYGETAKEAHDKQLACIKACSREPSVLRCERSCSKPSSIHHPAVKHAQPHHRTRKGAQPHHAPVKSAPASQFKVGRAPVKPATTLVKGRRVVLIRKH